MKKMNVMMGLVTVILAGTAGQAVATSVTTYTQVGGGTLDKNTIDFDALDTDHNGILTASEITGNAFFDGDDMSDIDKNSDGRVDGQELSEWARKNNKGNAVGSARGYAGVPIRDKHGNLVPLEPLKPVRPGDEGAVTR